MSASALIAIVLLAQSPPPQVSNGLAMARQLYAAGAYEEALVQLAPHEDRLAGHQTGQHLG